MQPISSKILPLLEDFHQYAAVQVGTVVVALLWTVAEALFLLQCQLMGFVMKNEQQMPRQRWHDLEQVALHR